MNKAKMEIYNQWSSFYFLILRRNNRMEENHCDLIRVRYILTNILFPLLKQSEDSYEVFKAFGNFSTTSRFFNYSVDDKLLLNLSYRYVRGRSRFVKRKLNDIVKSSDVYDFNKFISPLLEVYHPSEYLPALTKLLLNIIRHSSYEFLQNYIHKLDTEVWCDLQRKRHPELKYASYWKPVTLIKAMKLAQEINSPDKALLLFNILQNYARGYHIGTILQSYGRGDRTGDFKLEEIQLAIQNGKLNYARNVGNIIQQNTEAKRFHLEPFVFNLFIKATEKIEITPELYDLPIAEQPWFFGCHAPLTISNSYSPLFLALSEKNKTVCVLYHKGELIISRKGRKGLVKTRVKIQANLKFDKNLLGNPKYYVPNSGFIQKVEIFKFHLSIVSGDIEQMKQIWHSHGMKWDDINNVQQPFSPILAVLESDNPKVEVLQCLEDLGLSTEKFYLPAYLKVEAKQLECLKYLLNRRAVVSQILIKRFLQHQTFWHEFWWRKLVTEKNSTGSSHKIFTKVFKFVLNEFSEIYKKAKYISEVKLLILLAHRFGTDSNYFSMLPKDLIRIILEMMDEKPLWFRIAKYLHDENPNGLQTKREYYKFYDMAQISYDREDYSDDEGVLCGCGRRHVYD